MLLLFFFSKVNCDPIKLEFGHKSVETDKKGQSVDLQFPDIPKDYKTFAIFHNSDQVEREDGKDMTPIVVNYTKLTVKPKKDHLNILISVGFLPSDCDTFNFHLGPQKENQNFTASKKACFLYSNVESLDISISENIDRYSVSKEMLQRTETKNHQSQIFILPTGDGTIFSYTGKEDGYHTGFYYIENLNSLKFGNEIKYIAPSAEEEKSPGINPLSITLFLVIPLIVLIALIVGGYYCFMNKKDKDTPQQVEEQNDQHEHPYKKHKDSSSSSDNSI